MTLKSRQREHAAAAYETENVLLFLLFLQQSLSATLKNSVSGEKSVMGTMGPRTRRKKKKLNQSFYVHITRDAFLPLVLLYS